MRFWSFVQNAATETAPESIELRIDGDIVDDEEAWIYEWFGIPVASPNSFRSELKKYEGKDITVWIDSYGGNVFAAAGIYNALMEHKGKITVKIDGKAMSAASVIAMAGGEILMSPVATMMIHNPLTEVYGYASDLRKAADVLDEVKESIMNAYQIKTGKSRNKIAAMMDDETYMSAKTAVKEGFADGVLFGKESESVDMAFKRHAITNSTAEALKKMVAMQKPNDAVQIAKAKLKLELEL
jgi:ATP-dependent Clp protease protease subunit